MKPRTVRRALFAILLISSVFLPSCEDKSAKEVEFNYSKILRKEYKYNVGKVVPVTIEQSTEIDGTVTADAEYLYFSSDRDNGNFDIYLRSLKDITTVRITRHPSKDTAPAISPNGKYLAFVSQREDPEGDIYVVRVKPKKLIASAAKSIADLPSLDDKARNLTQFQDPATKTVRIIKDSSPCWSPDGDWIAFSSTRGNGLENIWVMDRKGNDKIQITKKGGMYPRFSEDGKSIIYISYTDKGSNGDVYIVDFKTRRERRITNTSAIELYPSFMKNSHEIVYTLIDRDTNADGKIDLKDNSILYYRNLKTGLEYPLTVYSSSSFGAKWIPAFKSVDKEYDGTLLYSDMMGQNININIIPEYGIIPKKRNALQQYMLAEKYIKEQDDIEKYVMCLERVYSFFGTRKDTQSIIFVSKALMEAARLYHEYGYKKDAERLHRLVKSLSPEKNDFRNIAGRYLDKILSGRSGSAVLLGAIGDLEKDTKRKEFLPYMMEQLGDDYLNSKKTAEALKWYRTVAERHTKFDRIRYVEYKIGALSFRSVRDEIPQAYLNVLGSEFVYLKNDTLKNIIDVFSKEKDLKLQIRVADKHLKRFKDNKYLPGILEYILGNAYYRSIDVKNSLEHLQKCLKLVNKSDLTFYKANRLLGKIAEKMNRPEEMERYYYELSSNYQLYWQQPDFPRVLIKLISHYEKLGENLRGAGRIGDAVSLYQKYVGIITYVHLLKKYEDIYNEYGSRAHVLYVDTAAEGRGNAYNRLKKLEDKYIKRLPIARLDFDKAHLYGLAYIYSKMGLTYDRGQSLVGNLSGGLVAGDLENMLKCFYQSVEQIDWALFMDDTYVDPYLLKGWVFQYVDLKRKEDQQETGGKKEGVIGDVFPKYLWERNIGIYEKALGINDEKKYPEVEGNLHLNIGNTYYLLSNYPRALRHYEDVLKYKLHFNTEIEEAIYRFHLGFCYWQNDEIEKARDEMNRTLGIYQRLSAKEGASKYKLQIYYLYRYFALFSRMEENYKDAIAWFQKILQYADSNKIKVDRARYVQEIGYCYYEMGDADRALEYLDKAEKLLKDYKDDKKTYKMGFKIFGIGPIRFYDLGSDTAVIGDNKIYTELDTFNKKLLNLALQEVINFGRGNYQRAIEFLKKKLELLKDRNDKVNQEARIRTLNNIGYCYYMMHDYLQARDYFTQAWDYAASPDVNDLGGIFSTIMNISDLYAFLMDYKPMLLAEPEKSVNTVIQRMVAYKDSYEKNRFVQERIKLEADAKAKKRTIEEKELNALRKRIKVNAQSIYYSIDIAVGILKCYHAEQIYTQKSGGKGLDPTEYHAYNKQLFDLYSDARKRFENALVEADKKISKRLMVKLLLNLGTTQKRMGMIDDAYTSYLNAETIGKNMAYEDLNWVVYQKLGNILREHGQGLEGSGYTSLAEGYYLKAVRLVKTEPYLYMDKFHQVSALMDEYADFLIHKGAVKRALEQLELKSAIGRVQLVMKDFPDFARAEDRKNYKQYRDITRSISILKRILSSKLEKGEPLNSDKIKKVQKDLAGLQNQLKGVVSSSGKSNPLLRSYIEVSEKPLRGPRGSVVYRFMDQGNDVYCWEIKGSDITLNRVPLKENQKGGERDEAISSYLKGRAGRLGLKIFIILDDMTVRIFGNAQKMKGFPPFTFASSLDRTAYYARVTSGGLDKILFNGKGLKKEAQSSVSLKSLSVDELDINKADPARYAGLIDSMPDDRGINSGWLFKKKTAAKIVIKKREKMDTEQICLMAEASLYTGVQTLMLVDNTEPGNIIALLERYRTRSPAGAKVPPRDRFQGYIAIGVGEGGNPEK